MFIQNYSLRNYCVYGNHSELCVISYHSETVRLTSNQQEDFLRYHVNKQYRLNEFMHYFLNFFMLAVHCYC